MEMRRHDLPTEPLFEAIVATYSAGPDHHGEVRMDAMTDIRIDAPGVVCDPMLLDELCSVPGTSESHARHCVA